MTLHSNDGSRALVVPAVPLRKHQRRFFPLYEAMSQLHEGTLGEGTRQNFVDRAPAEPLPNWSECGARDWYIGIQ